MSWSVVSELRRERIDDWMLGKIIRLAIQELGVDEWIACREEFLIKILIEHRNQFHRIKDILINPQVCDYIHLHRFEDILYFHKESFEELIYWLFVTSIIDLVSQSETQKIPPGILERYETTQRFIEAAEGSRYRLSSLFTLLS
ncbi:TPA: hypothetical protein DCX15_04985 [bacterium]|nr:hypothetical protein [bacterium]